MRILLQVRVIWIRIHAMDAVFLEQVAVAAVEVAVGATIAATNSDATAAPVRGPGKHSTNTHLYK